MIFELLVAAIGFAAGIRGPAYQEIKARAIDRRRRARELQALGRYYPQARVVLLFPSDCRGSSKP